MSRICFNLTFDAGTEQAIRALWQHIDEEEIPVRGLTGYRPHITLAVYEVNRIDPYEAKLSPVASALDPFPVLLESLGVFPEHGVVFLAPRMSQRLFSLHRTVIEAFLTLNDSDRSLLVGDFLLPDRWVPHVTLAGSLTRPQVLKGLAICLQQWAPIQGYATGIGMRLFPDPADYRYYPFHR
jgi:2'-5' RNA ligase